MHNLTVFGAQLHRASFLNRQLESRAFALGVVHPDPHPQGGSLGTRKGTRDSRQQCMNYRNRPGDKAQLSPKAAPQRVPFLSRGSSQALRQRSFAAGSVLWVCDRPALVPRLRVPIPQVDRPE